MHYSQKIILVSFTLLRFVLGETLNRDVVGGPTGPEFLHFGDACVEPGECHSSRRKELLQNHQLPERMTLEAIVPNTWLSRKHGRLTYRDTQILTGCFGNFGPILRIPGNPAYGFGPVLLENGIFGPVAPRPLAVPPGLGHLLGPPIRPVDPYVLFVLSNFAKYLPYGLGSQGFYGSTGLPKPKPSGVFKYEKN